MNRMLRAAAAAAILTSGLGSVGCMSTGSCGSGGCGGGGNGSHGQKTLGDAYRYTNDPCYPERYNYAAREAVIAPFGQQVYNGYVLNQTIYNYHFEPGSDTLTPAGAEKLVSLSRARPGPDSKIYIQTARDLPPVGDPAKIVATRNELDFKRAAAIQKFMANQPSGGAIAFEIYVHDPATPGINSEMVAGAYRGSFLGYRGGITGAAGIGALGTGGAANLTVAPVINNGSGAGAGTGGAGTGGAATGGRP